MTLIIILSLILLYIAMFLALWLARKNSGALAWRLIAAAFFIAAAWKSVTLWQLLIGTIAESPNAVNETLILASTALFIGGFAGLLSRPENPAKEPALEKDGKIFEQQVVGFCREGTVEFDNDLTVTAWNDGMINIFGISDTKASGASILKLLNFLEKGSERQKLSLVLSGEFGTSNDVEFMDPMLKENRYFEVYYLPRFDQESAKAGGRLLIRDMTLCKSIASKEIFLKSKLIDLITDSFYIHDMEKIYYVNEQAYKTRGYTKDELLAMPVKELVAPEFIGGMEGRWRESLRGKKIIFESAHIRKDGTILPVEIHTRTTELDGKKVAVSICRDITQRKKVFAAIKESEKKYRTLIDSANDAVFLADAQTGIIIEANKAAEKMLKLPAEKIIGMHQMHLHPPEESENYKQIFMDYVKKGQGVIGGLYAVDKNGDRIPIEISSSLMEIEGKTILQGIFRDVSDRVRSKELSETLNDINSIIHSSLHIDERMQRVVKEMCEVIGCKSSAILLRGEKNWTYTDTYGLKHIQKGSRISNEEAKCAVYVVANREMLISDDALNDDRLNTDLVKKTGAKSLVSIPLYAKGKIIGIFDLYFNTKPLPLTDSELDFSAKLGGSISLAIENAALLDTELNIANTLQEALLKMPEQLHGIEFGNMYRSATRAAKVGGDFYDLFELEHNRVGIIIGDVSGKGLGAASLTSLVKNSIKAYCYDFNSPAMVMAKTNELLRNMTKEDMFITVFLGLLNTGSGRLNYCIAGHPPPVIRRHNGETDYLPISSPAIGAMSGLSFQEENEELGRGDVIIAYTDGVTEARRDDEFYGENRLIETITNKSVAAKDYPKLLFDDIFQFTRGELADDVAVLAVARRQ